MKYIFIVELNKEYVENCGKNGVSPSTMAVDFIKDKYADKLIVALKNDCYCQWVAPDIGAVEAQPIYDALCAHLVQALNLVGEDNVFTVRYYPYGQATQEQTAAADAAEDTRTQTPLESSIIGLTSDLIGGKEFVALIQEVARVAKFTANGNINEIINRQNYLFSIDDGYDIANYVDILREALRKAGLFGGDSTEVEVHTISAPKQNEDPFEEVKDSLTITKAHYFFVVNISNCLDNLRGAEFKSFLRAVSEQNKHVVVFVMPFVEKDALQRAYDAIYDVIDLRAVSFPPFSTEELQQTAERYLRTFGVTVQPETWPLFNSLIRQEKSDGNFYGVSTVNKVCRRMLYNKALFDAQNGGKDMTIRPESIASMEPDTSVVQEAQAMLDEMIGLGAVRAKLMEIVGQIEAAHKIPGMGAPSIHMRFVGNPGTGKTTVARIIGKILKERGLLRIGDLYEIHGRDLVGQYVGQTAPKTASMCRDAYGSVLFIDEAYSLCRNLDDTRDFGREALDTLIAQMENHRTDMVVIMAGYPDDIATMMKANYGLENRMPYLVEFPNYNRDELYQIFCLMVRKFGQYDEALLTTAKTFFDRLADAYINDKSFGNGRFVRNLFERTRAKAIMRCQINRDETICLTSEDFDNALSDREFSQVMPATERRKVGF